MNDHERMYRGVSDCIIKTLRKEGPLAYYKVSTCAIIGPKADSCIGVWHVLGSGKDIIYHWLTFDTFEF